MNRIIGVDEGGFQIGHTITGLTRGLWLWGMYEKGEDGNESVLLCLDTECLHDNNNGEKKDNTLFVLALLLSSVIVNNVSNNLDSGKLRDLAFITKLTKNLVVDNSSGISAVDLKKHMPHLVFLIRDSYLDYTSEGCSSEGRRLFEK